MTLRDALEDRSPRSLRLALRTARADPDATASSADGGRVLFLTLSISDSGSPSRDDIGRPW